MRANLMTQKELAKRLGVTQSYISKIEKGLRRIDLFELMEYCEATKISLTEFAARLEYRFASEFPEKKGQMNKLLSILQSYNLTPLHKYGFRK